MKYKILAAICITFSATVVHANTITHSTPNVSAVTIKYAGLMTGFPAAESKEVTKTNMGKYPYVRWTLQNANRLFPVAILANNSEHSILKYSSKPIFANEYLVNGQEVTATNYAKQTSTDALIVLHNGKIIDEWYGNGMTKTSPHYIASITKSITGLLAELMIYQKKLDPTAKVQQYIPELKDSPFSSVTVRQLLDMQVNVGVGETALTPDQETLNMWKVMGWGINQSNLSMYDFLPTIKPAGKNDGIFHYSSLTTEVAGWLISRASGKGVEELFKEEILDKIGTSATVYTVVDSKSKMLSSAGLNMSARDLASVGQMIANGGKFNNKQIIPKAVIKSIFATGDVEAWKKGNFTNNDLVKSYKSYWYQLGSDNAIMGMGVFGQSLYINPVQNIVMVKFASQPADIIDEYNMGWSQIMLQMVNKWLCCKNC